MQPVIEELGHIFASIPSLRIVTMNGQRNELYHPQVQIEGFPTILFFPSTSKQAPLSYFPPSHETFQQYHPPTPYHQHNADATEASSRPLLMTKEGGLDTSFWGDLSVKSLISFLEQVSTVPFEVYAWVEDVE